MTNQQIADKVLAYHKEWTCTNEEVTFFNLVHQLNKLSNRMSKDLDLNLIKEVHKHVAKDIIRVISDNDTRKRFNIWEAEQNKTEEDHQQT